MSVPDFSRLRYRRYVNQFCRPPGDSLFREAGKAFFLSRVQSTRTWTLTVEFQNSGNGVLRGQRENQFQPPLCIKRIVSSTDVTEVCGFWIETA